jgi:high-affinity Fe2+/Pb2+ permease
VATVIVIVLLVVIGAALLVGGPAVLAGIGALLGAAGSVLGLAAVIVGVLAAAVWFEVTFDQLAGGFVLLAVTVLVVAAVRKLDERSKRNWARIEQELEAKRQERAAATARPSGRPARVGGKVPVGSDDNWPYT